MSESLIQQGFLQLVTEDGVQRVFASLNQNKLSCYPEDPSKFPASRIAPIAVYDLGVSKIVDGGPNLKRPKSFALSASHADSSIIGEFACPTNSLKCQWIKSIFEASRGGFSSSGSRAQSNSSDQKSNSHLSIQTGGSSNLVLSPQPPRSQLVPLRSTTPTARLNSTESYLLPLNTQTLNYHNNANSYVLSPQVATPMYATPHNNQSTAYAQVLQPQRAAPVQVTNPTSLLLSSQRGGITPDGRLCISRKAVGPSLRAGATTPAATPAPAKPQPKWIPNTHGNNTIKSRLVSPQRISTRDDPTGGGRNAAAGRGRDAGGRGGRLGATQDGGNPRSAAGGRGSNAVFSASTGELFDRDYYDDQHSQQLLQQEAYQTPHHSHIPPQQQQQQQQQFNPRGSGSHSGSSRIDDLTVSDLREALQAIPPHIRSTLVQDSNGNSHSSSRDFDRDRTQSSDSRRSRSQSAGGYRSSGDGGGRGHDGDVYNRSSVSRDRESSRRSRSNDRGDTSDHQRSADSRSNDRSRDRARAQSARPTDRRGDSRYNRCDQEEGEDSPPPPYYQSPRRGRDRSEDRENAKQAPRPGGGRQQSSTRHRHHDDDDNDGESRNDYDQHHDLGSESGGEESRVDGRHDRITIDVNYMPSGHEETDYGTGDRNHNRDHSREQGRERPESPYGSDGDGDGAYRSSLGMPVSQSRNQSGRASSLQRARADSRQTTDSRADSRSTHQDRGRDRSSTSRQQSENKPIVMSNHEIRLQNNLAAQRKRDSLQQQQQQQGSRSKSATTLRGRRNTEDTLQRSADLRTRSASVRSGRDVSRNRGRDDSVSDRRSRQQEEHQSTGDAKSAKGAHNSVHTPLKYKYQSFADSLESPHNRSNQPSEGGGGGGGGGGSSSAGPVRRDSGRSELAMSTKPAVPPRKGKNSAAKSGGFLDFLGSRKSGAASAATTGSQAKSTAGSVGGANSVDRNNPLAVDPAMRANQDMLARYRSKQGNNSADTGGPPPVAVARRPVHSARPAPAVPTQQHQMVRNVEPNPPRRLSESSHHHQQQQQQQQPQYRQPQSQHDDPFDDLSSIDQEMSRIRSASNVSENMTDLAEWHRLTDWLRRNGLDKYVDLFRSNDITKLSIVELLTRDDMSNIGVDPGDIDHLIHRVGEFTRRTRTLSEQVLLTDVHAVNAIASNLVAKKAPVMNGHAATFASRQPELQQYQHQHPHSQQQPYQQQYQQNPQRQQQQPRQIQFPKRQPPPPVVRPGGQAPQSQHQHQSQQHPQQAHAQQQRTNLHPSEGHGEVVPQQMPPVVHEQPPAILHPKALNPFDRSKALMQMLVQPYQSKSTIAAQQKTLDKAAIKVYQNKGEIRHDLVLHFDGGHGERFFQIWKTAAVLHFPVDYTCLNPIRPALFHTKQMMEFHLHLYFSVFPVMNDKGKEDIRRGKEGLRRYLEEMIVTSEFDDQQQQQQMRLFGQELEQEKPPQEQLLSESNPIVNERVDVLCAENAVPVADTPKGEAAGKLQENDAEHAAELAMTPRESSTTSDGSNPTLSSPTRSMTAATFMRSREFAIYAGLVMVPEPQTNEAFAQLFKQDWIVAMRYRFLQFLDIVGLTEGCVEEYAVTTESAAAVILTSDTETSAANVDSKDELNASLPVVQDGGDSPVVTTCTPKKPVPQIAEASAAATPEYLSPIANINESEHDEEKGDGDYNKSALESQSPSSINDNNSKTHEEVPNPPPPPPVATTAVGDAASKTLICPISPPQKSSTKGTSLLNGTLGYNKSAMMIHSGEGHVFGIGSGGGGGVQDLTSPMSTASGISELTDDDEQHQFALPHAAAATTVSRKSFPFFSSSNGNGGGNGGGGGSSMQQATHQQQHHQQGVIAGLPRRPLFLGGSATNAAATTTMTSTIGGGAASGGVSKTAKAGKPFVPLSRSAMQNQVNEYNKLLRQGGLQKAPSASGPMSQPPAVAQAAIRGSPSTSPTRSGVNPSTAGTSPLIIGGGVRPRLVPPTGKPIVIAGPKIQLRRDTDNTQAKVSMYSALLQEKNKSGASSVSSSGDAKRAEDVPSSTEMTVEKLSEVSETAPDVAVSEQDVVADDASANQVETKGAERSNQEQAPPVIETETTAVVEPSQLPLTVDGLSASDPVIIDVEAPVEGPASGDVASEVTIQADADEVPVVGKFTVVESSTASVPLEVASISEELLTPDDTATSAPTIPTAGTVAPPAVERVESKPLSAASMILKEKGQITAYEVALAAAAKEESAVKGDDDGEEDMPATAAVTAASAAAVEKTLVEEGVEDMGFVAQSVTVDDDAAMKDAVVLDTKVVEEVEQSAEAETANVTAVAASVVEEMPTEVESKVNDAIEVSTHSVLKPAAFEEEHPTTAAVDTVDGVDDGVATSELDGRAASNLRIEDLAVEEEDAAVTAAVAVAVDDKVSSSGVTTNKSSTKKKKNKKSNK